MFGHRHSYRHIQPQKHNHRHHTRAHTHGTVDRSILTTERGIWAIKWSFVGLVFTAIFQVVIVVFSGSVALLADTIHNFGDAATTIWLWIAFAFSRLKPTKRFTYGFGRVEDLAGVAIVLTILFSAIVAGYAAIDRFMNPRSIEFPWAVLAAAVVGFVGNEAVAIFRIKVGKEIGSVALIADGHHARIDGWTSLSVVLAVVGMWLGFPLADPIVGMFITAVIFFIVWQSGRAVFTRMLDGVDPQVTDQIRHVATHIQGVHDVTEVRVRWSGHRLLAEVNIAVSPNLSIEGGHMIAMEVRHQLLHELRHLENAVIHVDPVSASGEEHHRIAEHVHDGLAAHSH